MTGEQKRYAVEAALLLGFQTETATFPVITADGEIPVPENMEELKALWKKSTGGTPEEYESASKHTGPINYETHGKRHAKQDIMDAAWKLFTEQGYDETTIAQIIELSGNSRSTKWLKASSRSAAGSVRSQV